jgi:hypothetical protein
MRVEFDLKGSHLVLEEDLAVRALAPRREWRCPQLRVSLDDYQCFEAKRHNIHLTEAILKLAIQLAVEEAPGGRVEVTYEHLLKAA